MTPIMIDTPSILPTEARETAVIRLEIPRADIQKVMGPAIQEVFATLAAQGISPTGPLFSYHLRMDPAVFDFEVGVPVAKPVTPAGRVTNSRLPAARVARTVYRGPYEGLPGAWSDLKAWLDDGTYTAGSSRWEYYAAGPESSPDPSQWRTELNWPLVGGA